VEALLRGRRRGKKRLGGSAQVGGKISSPLVGEREEEN